MLSIELHLYFWCDAVQDPGIGNMFPGKYAPYDDGMKQDVFIHNATGGVLVGKVLWCHVYHIYTVESPGTEARGHSPPFLTLRFSPFPHPFIMSPPGTDGVEVIKWCCNPSVSLCLRMPLDAKMMHFRPMVTIDKMLSYRRETALQGVL